MPVALARGAGARHRAALPPHGPQGGLGPRLRLQRGAARGMVWRGVAGRGGAEGEGEGATRGGAARGGATGKAAAAGETAATRAGAATRKERPSGGQLKRQAWLDDASHRIISEPSAHPAMRTRAGGRARVGCIGCDSERRRTHDAACRLVCCSPPSSSVRFPRPTSSSLFSSSLPLARVATAAAASLRPPSWRHSKTRVFQPPSAPRRPAPGSRHWTPPRPGPWGSWRGRRARRAAR